MMLRILMVLFSFICLSRQQYSCTEDWFTRSGLNTLMDKVPREKLTLYYDRRMVNLGNVFSPTAVRYQPYVFWQAKSNELYTLVMIDPDAGQYSQLRHWLVINIRGYHLNSGDSVSDYLEAGPPQDSGFHRYALLVYRQKARITDKMKQASSRSLKGRLDFNVNNFTKQYQLGDPIYENFFEAEYDSFVDKFYESLEDDE